MVAVVRRIYGQTHVLQSDFAKDTGGLSFFFII